MPRKSTNEKALVREFVEYGVVFASGGYSEMEVRRVWRIIQDGPSESDWRKLKVKYDLPEALRAFVRSCILIYWNHRKDLTISSEIKDRIVGAISAIKQSSALLIKISTDPDFYKGMFALHEPAPAEQRATIKGTIGSLLETEQLLNSALNRMKAPAHRPSHAAVLFGIMAIDDHLTLVKHPPENQSELAFEILKLGDPKLTKPAFRSVYKEFLAIRPHFRAPGLYGENGLQIGDRN